MEVVIRLAMEIERKPENANDIVNNFVANFTLCYFKLTRRCSQFTQTNKI